MPAGTIVASGSLVSPGGQQGPSGPAGATVPVGTVMAYCGGGSPPPAWMVADGSAVSRTLYPDLFTAIGTTFGTGDGSTTFNLPDLRGRTPVGRGQGTYTGASNRVLAASGGEETHQLITAEMPSHSHTIAGGPFMVFGAGSSSLGTGTSILTSNNTQTTGNDTAHNTMPPFLVLVWIIKVSVTGGPTAQAPIANQTQAGLMNILSGNATDYVGGDNACHSFAFVAKTAAYALTIADSAKYIICSGGSWTLTLPAPVAGANYRLRNDMGISGTTGTITLQPTSGTVDGLASQVLLAGQECTLISDGTNWRTFGRQRVVVLGTIDISGSPTAINILLPTGYREFELDLYGVATTGSASQTIIGYFSNNGGSTWDTAAHYSYCYIVNSTTAAVVSGQGNQNTAYAYLTPLLYTAFGSVPSAGKITIFPGNATILPGWIAETGGFAVAAGFYQTFLMYGWDNLTGPVNAIQLQTSSALAFTGGQITVKGVV